MSVSNLIKSVKIDNKYCHKFHPTEPKKWTNIIHIFNGYPVIAVYIPYNIEISFAFGLTWIANYLEKSSNISLEELLECRKYIDNDDDKFSSYKRITLINPYIPAGNIRIYRKTPISIFLEYDNSCLENPVFSVADSAIKIYEKFTTRIPMRVFTSYYQGQFTYEIYEMFIETSNYYKLSTNDEVY